MSARRIFYCKKQAAKAAATKWVIYTKNFRDNHTKNLKDIAITAQKMKKSLMGNFIFCAALNSDFQYIFSKTQHNSF